MAFLEDVKMNFYQTFVVDNRYLYFLDGLKNTLIIAFFSIIVGLCLGALFAFIRDYHKETGKLSILNKIIELYITIIRGTPTLLQLMIIYYVIFKSINISVIIVGIITFGLNSSAYVAEIFRAGFDGTFKGQREAAKTLGLSYMQTMQHVIFPQAIRNIFPALGNEAITLLKETSIAGYIGIVELIKASDIVSSNTYDYFFPLTVSACIFLLLTHFLSKGMKFIEGRLSRYV